MHSYSLVSYRWLCLKIKLNPYAIGKWTHLGLVHTYTCIFKTGKLVFFSSSALKKKPNYTNGIEKKSVHIKMQTQFVKQC